MFYKCWWKPLSKVAYHRISKYIITVRISRLWSFVCIFIIVPKIQYPFSFTFEVIKKTVQKYLSCRWCLSKTKVKTRETVECYVSYVGRCSLSVYHICNFFYFIYVHQIQNETMCRFDTSFVRTNKLVSCKVMCMSVDFINIVLYTCKCTCKQ